MWREGASNSSEMVIVTIELCGLLNPVVTPWNVLPYNIILDYCNTISVLSSGNTGNLYVIYYKFATVQTVHYMNINNTPFPVHNQLMN